jgi:hypothetical protein
MSLERSLRGACLGILLLALAGSARAQYSLVGPSDGGQILISKQLPLPLQPLLVPTGPGVWPPLRIPPAPGVTIMQGPGGTLTLPPHVLSRPAPGIPVASPRLLWNPFLFQIATSGSYGWPATTATLAPGGGPGSTVFATPSGGSVAYSGGVNAFGGPARFALSAGPAARAPGAPVTLWINRMAQPPGPTDTAVLVPVRPGALPGSAGTKLSNHGGTIPSNLVNAYVGASGTILASAPFGTFAPTSALIAGYGFPWTTGTVTISQPNLSPPAVVVLSGTDQRVNGVGNISLVAGGLSHRSLTAWQANQGWIRMTLPEPSAAAGLATALASLGLCQRLVRRRRP